MFDSLIHHVEAALVTLVQYAVALFALIPFGGATWFVLFVLGFFVWLFKKGDQDPKSPIQWEHLIIDSSNNRASPYKTGYLIGLIVGTWIVVYLTDKNLMNVAIFSTYLTYLLGGAGGNMIAKRGLESAPVPPCDDAPSPPADASLPPTPCDHEESPQRGIIRKLLFHIKKLISRWFP